VLAVAHEVDEHVLGRHREMQGDIGRYREVAHEVDEHVLGRHREM